MTGTVMRASRRLQLNVRISPVTEPPTPVPDDILPAVSDIVFPIAWLEEVSTTMILEH